MAQANLRILKQKRWAGLLLAAAIGVWASMSSAQTLKRLDQVAPYLKSDSTSAPSQQKAAVKPRAEGQRNAEPAQSFSNSAPKFKVQPPPPIDDRYQAKTPPAKTAEPAIATDLDKANGAKLCQIVSGDPSALFGCLQEVNNMNGKSLMQIALRVCVRRVGLASVQSIDRRVPCFGFASRLVQDAEFQGKAAWCQLSGIGGPQPGECLHSLFSTENARVQAGGSGSTSGSSSSTVGTYNFQRAKR